MAGALAWSLARGSMGMSDKTIVARMRGDGTVVRVMPDGSEEPFPHTPTREMTEEEIEAAALSDPDAQPLTEEQLARARRVPRVKTLRRARADAGGVCRALRALARHAARLGARAHAA